MSLPTIGGVGGRGVNEGHMDRLPVEALEDKGPSPKLAGDKFPVCVSQLELSWHWVPDMASYKITLCLPPLPLGSLCQDWRKPTSLRPPLYLLLLLLIFFPRLKHFFQKE